MVHSVASFVTVLVHLNLIAAFQPRQIDIFRAQRRPNIQQQFKHFGPSLTLQPQQKLTAFPFLSIQNQNDEDRTFNTRTVLSSTKITIWELLANQILDIESNPGRRSDYVQLVTLLRVGVPSFLAACVAKLIYPTLSMIVAGWIVSGSNGEAVGNGVFAVVSQDASQYIQNILTTSGLVFSILVGQTYYFMYQQQEAIYLALFEEVTMAKSLLEQVALVCQGREALYRRILLAVDFYVKNDLVRFNDVDPAEMISRRPCDDPLETILYLTSVGEPSIVYQTVKNLRQARAYRLGALQRKLPDLHMTLLWALAAIVLFTFPLLGAGSQTIGGSGILTVQSFYLSFIVFGIGLVMGIIYELRKPSQLGAYNASSVLLIMVEGLEQELQQRLDGDVGQIPTMAGPSVDSFDKAI